LNGLDSQDNRSFDDQGRQVERTSFDRDGKVLSSYKTDYETDKIIEDGYDPDGNPQSQEITYLKGGKPTKREDSWNGALSKTILYLYGEDGSLSQEVGTDESGAELFKVSYSYAGTNVASKRLTNADGTEYLTEYTYDTNGRLLALKHSVRVDKFGKTYFETDYSIEREHGLVDDY
jgi:antitoxin component YwqK of YwqJK toxin-antitoxin module